MKIILNIKKIKQENVSFIYFCSPKDFSEIAFVEEASGYLALGWMF